MPESNPPSTAFQPPISVLLEGVHLSLESAAGSVHILRGVDLAIHEGESVSIVGPSGSGKSTLMAVMGGLEKISEGEVRVVGQPLNQLVEDQLALFRRENVGIVFQAFHLIPTMTALENVVVPLEFSGVRGAEARAVEELEAVGLGERLHHYPSQLSGGEQQRVALARAMVTAPRLLLADEPTGNLDGETGSEIIDLLFERNKAHGATCVLITHDLGLAERCDRVIHLRDGRIIDPEMTHSGDKHADPSVAHLAP